MLIERSSAGTVPHRRVTPVRYTPPDDYQLEVEVVAAEELRERIAQVDDRGIERIDFHCLLLVAGGTYTHMVDFETYACTEGSCVIIQPGQVHRFGNERDWTGWMLILRSDLQPRPNPALLSQAETILRPDALPAHVHTSGITKYALIESVQRMASDATQPGDSRVKNALLRGQFQLLLARVHLAHLAAAVDARIEPRLLERYRDFRSTAEREFRRWHAVAPYARHLGCSVKSLNRATIEVAGVSAKAFLVARIVLEAQRLLAHTTLPVSAISEQLGFDEATTFVKFFRRETGSTPGAFRVQRAS